MEPVQLPQKLYLRIGEVARVLNVKPHVIRFWEKEFKSWRALIRPPSSGPAKLGSFPLHAKRWQWIR